MFVQVNTAMLWSNSLVHYLLPMCTVYFVYGNGFKRSNLPMILNVGYYLSFLMSLHVLFTNKEITEHKCASFLTGDWKLDEHKH
jgi:hypothetical protein